MSKVAFHDAYDFSVIKKFYRNINSIANDTPQVAATKRL